MVKVKAWAVIARGTNEIGLGDMLEDGADCACRAFTTRAATIFGSRKEAVNYANSFQLVVPCEITYTPQ